MVENKKIRMKKTPVKTLEETRAVVKSNVKKRAEKEAGVKKWLGKDRGVINCSFRFASYGFFLERAVGVTKGFDAILLLEFFMKQMKPGDMNIYVMSQANIGKMLGFEQGLINKWLYALKQLDAVVKVKNGEWMINPDLAWKGNLNDLPEACEKWALYNGDHHFYDYSEGGNWDEEAKMTGKPPGPKVDMTGEILDECEEFEFPKD